MRIVHNNFFTLLCSVKEYLYILIAALLLHSPLRGEVRVEPDTLVVVESIEVTAIKQGLNLRNEGVAATVVGKRDLEGWQIAAPRDLSAIAPNFHSPQYGSRMTSSIYVRGLGTRIDQPVVGLNIDNVPIISKDAYDLDQVDIERIEVLRGPQSTLYGRNTMGGVINIYTLSPLSYEGVRLGFEYSSGNSYKSRASAYMRINPNTGFAAIGFFNHSDGLFRNEYDSQLLDWERSAGGRVKFATKPSHRFHLENTLSFSTLKQGGYPYASVASGEICYNDPAGYRRVLISDGLTMRYNWERLSLWSNTSIQYIDDKMNLDQDFLPKSYFTLEQARREYALTEELILRSRGNGNYSWLVGLFGLYKSYDMSAPVIFKEHGLKELIIDNVEKYTGYAPVFYDEEYPLLSDFESPTWNIALYHESRYEVGRWLFTLGLRAEYESARLDYLSSTTSTCRIVNNEIKPFNLSGRLKNSFFELLPKLSLRYSMGENREHSLYLSVSKGFKAGGFNTQMFSEVLQNALMEKMGAFSDRNYDIERVVSYDPESSWNYELGGHFEAFEGDIRADAALFFIDCRDQQLTTFPKGQTTGRMMTNAGRTHSWGGELSLQIRPAKRLHLNAAYGYTNAKFVEYMSGNDDFKGKRVPYSPEHTLSASLSYDIAVNRSWLERITPSLNYRGCGSIAWNEANTLIEGFYSLVGFNLRFEAERYAIDIWGKNLLNTHYNTFYFKSIGNDFVQRGLPRTFGISLSLSLL